MSRLLLLIYVLSTVDGVLTVLETQLGVEEANPLMRFFFVTPAMFMLAKSLLVGVAISFVYRQRRHTHIVVPGSITILAFYVGVLAFHVYGLSFLL